MDPWHSRPLDVHRWSDYPQINDFVDQVYEALNPEQQQTIRGRSNNLGKSSGKRHLKVLLLDLFVAWKTDPELCLGVARSNGAYTVNSRYNALHISPRIAKFVDVLTEAGFVDYIQGSFHRDGTKGRNRTSRIKATSKLQAVFSQLDIEPYLIDLHHQRECIILRPDLLNEDQASTKKLIEYEDTPQTNQMRDRLEDYNNFLSETYIDIPSLTDPWITRPKANGDVQLIPIGQTNKFVRRIFSRGSWSMNGRFYGGWWQQISKALRSEIAINNEPTVEIDYKGLHVAILSAWNDAPPRRDDRYKLKKQLLPHITKQEQRDIIKLLVLTAINAKSEKSAFTAFRDDQPTGTTAKRLKNTELSMYLDAFLEENPHLQGELCADRGIHLMYLDSQITDKIITSFIEHERPILTVHDSYIVGTFDTGHLTEAMSRASKEVVGQDLAYEQSVPGYSDVVAMQKHNRNRYLDTFSEVLALKNKTPQYEVRLRRFMEHRWKHFENTYWLGEQPTPTTITRKS